jgi:hypothetical protein
MLRLQEQSSLSSEDSNNISGNPWTEIMVNQNTPVTGTVYAYFCPLNTPVTGTVYAYFCPLPPVPLST